MQLSASVNTEFDERRFARELARALLAELDQAGAVPAFARLLARELTADGATEPGAHAAGEVREEPDFAPGSPGRGNGEPYFEREPEGNR